MLQMTASNKKQQKAEGNFTSLWRSFIIYWLKERYSVWRLYRVVKSAKIHIQRRVFKIFKEYTNIDQCVEVLKPWDALDYRLYGVVKVKMSVSPVQSCWNSGSGICKTVAVNMARNERNVGVGWAGKVGSVHSIADELSICRGKLLSHYRPVLNANQTENYKRCGHPTVNSGKTCCATGAAIFCHYKQCCTPQSHLALLLSQQLPAYVDGLCIWLFYTNPVCKKILYSWISKSRWNRITRPF